MPRKSMAAISTLPAVNAKHNRIHPRADASAEVRDIFSELVRSQRPEHFRPGDEHLIEQYAQSVILAQKAFAELELSGPVSPDGRMSPWVIALEKAHRSSVALAARLRLCPQSRLSARSAGRAKPPPSIRKIWEVD
jgi:hypothetical protein